MKELLTWRLINKNCGIKEQIMKGSKQSLTKMWDKIKCIKMYVIWVPERMEIGTGVEKILEHM